MYFFRFAQLVHAFLGLVLGLLVYLIDIYTPKTIHPALWIALTLVLIINGLLLGNVIKRLYLHGYLDDLTELGNKGLFYFRLKLALSERKDRPLALAMIDVDDFKKINDIYGHPAGDMALKSLANILRLNVRSTDTLVRWGGEEFAIILPQTSLEGATKLLDRIRSLIESHDFGSDLASSKITVSVGIATHVDVERAKDLEDNSPSDLLVSLADKALYRAKESKNAVVCFGSSPGTVRAPKFDKLRV